MPRDSGKSEAGDYRVGYGRPPKHSQFKSGAPQFVSVSDREPVDVAAILDQTVTATRDGKTVKLHAHEAKMLALAKKAIGRNVGAIDQFLKECEKAGLLDAPPGPQRSGVIMVPEEIERRVVGRLVELTGHGPPWDEDIYAAVVAELEGDDAL